MMRDLLISDLVELERHAQFPLDFLINKPKIVEKTFEDDEGVVGSIIVTGTLELTAIFNYDRPKGTVRALKELPEFLYRTLTPKGYRDIHAFIKDPKFANILTNHFGFEDVVGRALVKRV